MVEGFFQYAIPKYEVVLGCVAFANRSKELADSGLATDAHKALAQVGVVWRLKWKENGRGGLAVAVAVAVALTARSALSACVSMTRLCASLVFRSVYRAVSTSPVGTTRCRNTS